jgi:hypothetical protein
MQRHNPVMIESRRIHAGSLPTVEDFAHAIVDCAANTQLESGATIFVVSTEWEIA